MFFFRFVIIFVVTSFSRPKKKVFDRDVHVPPKFFYPFTPILLQFSVTIHSYLFDFKIFLGELVTATKEHLISLFVNYACIFMRLGMVFDCARNKFPLEKL